jgi:CRISPR-associated endonuclease/helicase Cas3
MRDELRVRGDRRAYRFDHLKEEWVICRAADLRPGLVLILDADEGGYDEELGWSPKSKAPVRDVSAHGDDADPVSEEDLATGADPLSERRRCWLALEQHLDDVQKEVANLAGELDVSGLQSGHLEAAVMAGRLHDVGKAHAEFQGMLHSCAQDDEEEAAARAAGTPLAKSGGSGRGRHERRYFRHELVSALALLNEGSAALEKVKEADLVVYLVASHHGRVRLGFRSLPEERLPDEFPSGTPIALGVVQGEKLDRVRVPGGEVPRSTMDLSVMGLGAPEGSRSWSERALALRDRPDLGPFRLGFLEALVRVSDWRASAAADERGT